MLNQRAWLVMKEVLTASALPLKSTCVLISLRPLRLCGELWAQIITTERQRTQRLRREESPT
jgi:hypothetical protein